MKTRQCVVGLMFICLLGACGANVPQPTHEIPTLAALPTLTPTATPTVTPSSAPTAHLSDTPTLTTTPSSTPSVTPSATITDTPTPTPSDTPTITNTPEPTSDNEGIVALALLAAQATVLPQQLLPAAAPTATFITLPPPAATSCAFQPSGGFGIVYQNDPGLNALIGCPLGAPPITASMPSASQLYERGEMFWLAGPPSVIYALFNTGRFQRYDDTYVDGVDPVSGGEIPPAGLKEPIRGFGKVWRTFGEVRGMGWALLDESGGQATVQIFDRGVMVYLPQRGLIVTLINDPGGLAGSWRMTQGSF
jgi:hypothetical protein